LAEDIFKNVQVLRGIPVDEFMDTMGFFAASLGLNCTSCHGLAVASDVTEFADETTLKRTARKMILSRPRLVMSDGKAGLGAALDRLWLGVAHQRCTVHKLRNLLAKASKHAHEGVREDYHRIVYAETRDEAQRAHAAFLLSRRSCVLRSRRVWRRPASNY
jgi:hypothetical protein